MKIQVSTKEMQEVIKKAVKVMPKNASMSMLEKLYIEAHGLDIKAIATDFTNTMVFNLNGQVIEEGETLLDTVTLKMIGKLKNNNILIERNKVTADKKQIEFEIYSKQVENFPTNIPECDEYAFITKEKELIDLLVVRYASSTEDSKVVFKSVCFDKEYIYASDTYRLTRRILPFTNELNDKMLIYLDAAKLLNNLLDKKENKDVSCSVNMDEKLIKFISFKTDQWQFITRQLDGNFPNVERFIPKEFAGTITLNCKQILDELEFANAIKTSKQELDVRFKLDDNNIISIDVSDKSGKHFKTHLDSNLSGEFSEFTLNSMFITDTVKFHDDENITLSLHTGKNREGIDMVNAVMVGNDLILPIRRG